jgi:hypothetical protein
MAPGWNLEFSQWAREEANIELIYDNEIKLVLYEQQTIKE